MPENYLLSTAYFPPIHYFSIIFRADNIFIEKEENYLKQTYRNRCLILTSNGPSPIIVPVLSGRKKKIPVKDIRIDYSKRWQQIHLRALRSSYKSSAYFDYYFDDIEKFITRRSDFLLELNLHLLETVLKITGISTPVRYTDTFEPVSNSDHDLRYTISPKKEDSGISTRKEYFQVFSKKFAFVPGLSILDLIFNTGPDAVNYL